MKRWKNLDPSTRELILGLSAPVIAIGVVVLFWLWLAATAQGADCLPGQPCATTPAWQGTPIGVAPIAKTRAAVRGVENICRVENHCGNYIDRGSGVLVYSDERAGFAQVVTVAHIFSDGRGRIVVMFGSRQFEAQIQHVDPTWDFAVLRIACPRGIRPVRIATSLPTVGTRLHAGGYLRSGAFRWAAGRFRGWVSMKGRSERRLLNIHARALSGQSGGPITDASGTLVGIISHSGCGDPRCRGCDKSGPEALTVGPSITVIAPHIGLPNITARPPEHDAPPVVQHDPPEHGGQLQTTAKAIAELRVDVSILQDEVLAWRAQVAFLTSDIAALKKRLAILESRSVAAGTAGPRGPSGESIVGPPGKDGAAGPPGATPTVDMDDLVKRLPPWYLRTVHMGVDGKTIESVTVESIPLGAGFTLFVEPREENVARPPPTK